MSTSMLVLNLGLLAWILAANLGTRPVTLRRLLLPLVVVAGVAAGYLEDVPTLGNDVALETALAGAGVLLGVVAGLLVPVFRRAGAASGEPAHSAQSQQSAQSQRSGRSGVDRRHRRADRVRLRRRALVRPGHRPVLPRPPDHRLRRLDRRLRPDGSRHGRQPGRHHGAAHHPGHPHRDGTGRGVTAGGSAPARARRHA